MITSEHFENAPLVERRYPIRYYRKVTENVLRWYFELADGVIQTDTGPVFDTRILDYRLDVEAVLGKFSEAERKIVELIHRDGIDHELAVRLSGLVSEHADTVVQSVERRMGQLFEERKLSKFLDYVGYLR